MNLRDQLRIIFQKIKETGKTQISKNFFSLSVLQAANILLPLLTFPYLIQTIGIEKFGLLGVALALINYFEIVQDYGFNFSATKFVSQNRDDANALNKIFSAITIIKLVFTSIGLAVLIVLFGLFDQIGQYKWIYLLTFGRVIGGAIYPIWLYQGLEKMKFITYFSVSAKVISSALIFVLIQSENDFYLAPILNSAGFILPGIVAQVHIYRVLKLKISPQPLHVIQETIKDGFHIFLSRVYVNIYNSFNVFILGIMTTYSVAGYYAVAAKIIEAGAMIFIPANSAIFPHLAKVWKTNKLEFQKLIRKMKMVFISLGSTIGVILFILAGPIVSLVNSKPDFNIELTLRILCLKMPIIALGSLFTSSLINQGRNKDYLWVVRNTFLANILLVPLGIYLFEGHGLAAAVVIVSVLHIFFFSRKIKSPLETGSEAAILTTP